MIAPIWDKLFITTYPLTRHLIRWRCIAPHWSDCPPQSTRSCAPPPPTDPGGRLALPGSSLSGRFLSWGAVVDFEGWMPAAADLGWIFVS